jgi:hypothetical protein
MEKQNRRQALMTLSALALAGCGGGSDSGQAAAGSAAAREAAQALEGLSARERWFLPVPVGQTPPPYRLWDAGSGPTKDYWSQHLLIKWKTQAPQLMTGDWLDAAGTAQGALPFATFTVKELRPFEVDITALAQRWLSSGKNKGVYLRGSGVSGYAYATWSGRQSAVPPLLQVQTSDGAAFDCPGLVATLDPSTYKGFDTRLSHKHTARNPALLQFFLDEVSAHLATTGATLAGAVMKLNCESCDPTRPFTVKVFEVDAPEFVVGAGGKLAAPHQGLAKDGEAALRNHPDVLRTGDFSDMRRGVLFDEIILDSRSPYEQLPDPDAPGTVMLRGKFTAGVHHSFSGVTQVLRADTSDPLRPGAPDPSLEELYCRLYFMLEEDWSSTVDGTKMALGWDLRMGWWNDFNGGYWYSTAGNGGRRGTGKKSFAPKGTFGPIQSADRWSYEGHSIRAGTQCQPPASDGNPYTNARPLQDYMYSLDQPTDFGELLTIGSTLLVKGRWHCLEQRIRINSVDTTVTDELGNGTANPDGELDTWLDGVLVHERRGLAWRCHPEMGIRGPWLDWYFGGRAVPEVDMHYRMNHFVLARQYIGPRVG